MHCKLCDNYLEAPLWPSRLGVRHISVCMNCGNIGIWDEGSLRGPTIEELRVMWTVPDPVIRAAVQMKAETN